MQSPPSDAPAVLMAATTGATKTRTTKKVAVK